MEKKSSSKELPTDIIYQILLCLPVKILSRFKCASKSWCSLISCPLFQQDHYGRSQQIPLVLTTRYKKEANGAISLHFSTYTDDLTLVTNFSKVAPWTSLYIDNLLPIQDCLGLVCIAQKNETILICNPSTEELMALPPLTSELVQCIGFGIAASTEKFKVVRFFHRWGKIARICFAEVFTVGIDKEWRKPRSSPLFMFVDRACAPFLLGALHVLSFNSDYRVQGNDCIAAFDVENEEFREMTIPLPEYVAYNTVLENMHLKVIRGSLCLVFGVAGHERTEVWMLKDYDNAEWVNVYNIDFSSLIKPPWLKYVHVVHPLVIMDNESILLNRYSSHGGAVLLCYDSRDTNATHVIGKDCSATVFVERFLPLETR